MGNVFQKSGGGGCSSPASTPVAVNKSDHEAHVQFAREFVVELVETVPKKSEKAALTEHLEEEDIVSLKSITPSEGSLQSGISVAGSTSLPDLLQPEFVYKKQTDTDTDTTEYESAAEIDPLDAASPVGNLIVRDPLSDFQVALDEKGKVTESAAAGSPVEPVVNNKAESIENSIISSDFEKTFECKTVIPDCFVSQTSESSSLSESYEDAGDTTAKTSAGEFQVKSIDISGLCLCIDNLSLDSPRTEKGNLPFDSKDSVYNSYSGSDVSVPVCNTDISGSGKYTQFTNQLQDFAPTSSGDSTFVLENSEEYGLGVLQNFEISSEADGTESPQKNSVLEASKTFDSEASLVEDNLPTLAKNSASTTNTTEIVKTDENIEVEFSNTVEECNHIDIHQAVAESNEIQDKISFVAEYSKEVFSKESVAHNTENIQVCQGLVTINDAQENHVVDVRNFEKSDITEEIWFTEAEDINSNSSKVSTPISSTVHVEERSLHTNITDPVKETDNCLKIKSLYDLESAWTSTSHEDLSVDKEAISVFTGITVHNKSEAEGGITFPVETEQLDEVAKKTPSVLSQLFEICNRQQKDLDSEKFVDGTEFFSSLSKSGNLREKVELHVPRSSVPSRSEESVLDQPVSGEFKEFDQTIADEAESILQEIMNSSSECNETDLTESDNRYSNSNQKTNSVNITGVMADMQRMSNSTATAVEENSVNPFVSQSYLNRSPPPCGKSSPRSSSSVPSPCESPRTKSKLSSKNSVKDSSSHNHESGDASPNTLSGKNSPDHRTSCNKESSPKSSVNPEVNQSEAGPEIADGTQLYSRDVFQDPATFEYLSSVGNSHAASDLRKESLYVKFDPLVGGISRTTDKSVPLPPSVETKSSVPEDTSSEKEHQSSNTTPVKNPALSVIDKLISLSPSPSKSPTRQPVISPVKEPVPTLDRQEAADNCSEAKTGGNETMTEELYLLRELCATQDAKYKERMAQLERELVTFKSHVENLQCLVRESEDRENKLIKKVAEKAQAQKQMSIIMEEYEKTISRLVAEKEQERQAHELDKSTLLKDRDAAMGHLANIEIAFSDLHKKYEKSKVVIEGFKKNEEVLRASLGEYEATIRKQEQKYDMLKSHAMAQLESANQELDSVRRSQQAEAAKLKAMLKKSEVKTSSLEEMLEQKVKENQELASICDELISKVGGSE